MKTRIDHSVRAIVVGFVLLLGNPQAMAETPSRWVRVPADQYGSLRSAAVVPRQQVNYGSFLWLEVDEAGFDRLLARGIRFTEVPNAGMVQAGRFTFDPIAEGEPPLAQHLRRAEGEPGLRLIQLVGPMRDEWIRALRSEGVQILHYHPHNAVLAWVGRPVTASSLPFIRWQGVFHPGYKISPSLDHRQGTIRNVDVMFFNDSDVKTTLRAIAAAGGEVLFSAPSQPDKTFFDAVVELDADALEAVAAIPTVVWLGFASRELEPNDEMSDQIVAGNHSGGVPFTGYLDHLSELDVDGSGVTWAVLDTGVDYDHPDLGPRIVGGVSFPGACDPPGQPGSDCSERGHGTHVAGIIAGLGVGDEGGPYTDSYGFNYGLGVAPGAGIFAMNFLSTPLAYLQGGWQELSKQALLGGAIGGNNSWGLIGVSQSYSSDDRVHDFMVRDGNFDTTTVAEPIIEVFSAGNYGPEGIASPKQAKNVIVVASTVNARWHGDIDRVATTSSWGPAADGRWVPTVAAPGAEIASARADNCTIMIEPIAGTHALYRYGNGTSMAAPHVSGALALIAQWWRRFNEGTDPSPAMAKALLVNGAVDMGEADVPNIHEGWGRIDATALIQPKAPVLYFDQEVVFSDSGQVWSVDVTVDRPDQPLKLTLAWSDAPGQTEANPALVNDLDLEVITSGSTYYGNQFVEGRSDPGGSPDSLNNLENVFVDSPGATASIIVRASQIAGDGVPYEGDQSDQDFALVCFNCADTPSFSIEVAPEAMAVCSPNPAVFEIEVDSFLGYSDSVSLSLDGLPTDATASFEPAEVIPPATSTLTINSSQGGTSGLFTIEITGTAGTTSKWRPATLALSTRLPDVPTPVSPEPGSVVADLHPTFFWIAPAQALEYEIEIARDAAFVEVEHRAVVQSTSYAPPANLAEQQDYFWRVRAANHCGNGAFSEPYRLTTPRIPLVLLVDDDDDHPDGRPRFCEALDALAIGYDVWDVASEGAEPDSFTLGPYQTVIWFTGLRLGGHLNPTAGPGAEGEAALVSFLDSGGRLVLSSMFYLFDFDRTQLAVDYLGIENFRLEYELQTVTGAGQLARLGPFDLDDDYVPLSCSITPDSGADAIFVSDLGVHGVGNGTTQYNAFFLAFPFEAIASRAGRIDVMNRLVRWSIFTDDFESGNLGDWTRQLP